MATSTGFFLVEQDKVSKCPRCGVQIFWQRSWRTGSRYPTDVLEDGFKRPITRKNNFHKCKQADIDALRRVNLEKAGQTNYWEQFETVPDKKLDMSGVNRLFDKAIASGLLHPKIRLQTPTGQPVALARAGSSSRYKGQIMVTDGERFGSNKYFGRVDQNGTFHPSEPQPEICTLLEGLGADPAKVAAGYGKLTGNCCFCLRRLDDARSVSVGYGPICAGHYGLPWG